MKISVVIPLYNKRDTILRALNSVICQTILPFEILVVDDGSTDGSGEIVTDFNSDKIRLITQTNNGVSGARNRGVAEAKGNWIAFLDADDLWLPEYLETILSLSERHPGCNLIATSYQLQDQKGTRRIITLKQLPFQEQDGLLSNYFEVSSSSHPPLCSSAVTIKKSALEEIGGFPVGIKSGEDLVTWARLAIQNSIAYSVRPLSVFVQDEAHSYNERPKRVPQEPDFVGDELEYLARLHRETPGIRHYVAHWHKMRASIFLRLGMKGKAFTEAIKALSFKPFNSRLLVYLFLILVPSSMMNQIFKRFGNT